MEGVRFDTEDVQVVKGMFLLMPAVKRIVKSELIMMLMVQINQSQQ